MHIHVGTGNVARTSVTVPNPDFRVFISQPKCFVMTQVFPCGIKLKTGNPKSLAVLQRSLALQHGAFLSHWILGPAESSQAVLVLKSKSVTKAATQHFMIM